MDAAAVASPTDSPKTRQICQLEAKVPRLQAENLAYQTNWTAAALRQYLKLLAWLRECSQKHATALNIGVATALFVGGMTGVIGGIWGLWKGVGGVALIWNILIFQDWIYLKVMSLLQRQPQLAEGAADAADP